jgi:hypothetical protein
VALCVALLNSVTTLRASRQSAAQALVAQQRSAELGARLKAAEEKRSGRRETITRELDNTLAAIRALQPIKDHLYRIADASKAEASMRSASALADLNKAEAAVEMAYGNSLGVLPELERKAFHTAKIRAAKLVADLSRFLQGPHVPRLDDWVHTEIAESIGVFSNAQSKLREHVDRKQKELTDLLDEAVRDYALNSLDR